MYLPFACNEQLSLKPEMAETGDQSEGRNKRCGRSSRSLRRY